MIETERQRRWWFATHPEYSWSGARRGGGVPGSEGDEELDPMSPQVIDAEVDESLKYETNPVGIALLNEVKFWLGTEFASKTPVEKYALLRDDDDSAETDYGMGGSGPSGQRYTLLDESSSRSDAASRSGEKDRETDEVSFWDAVLIGINNTFHDWERWFGIGLGLASPSRELAKSMIAAGKPRPDGHYAHHIVATFDRRAEKARRILDKFGININDTANGVWLPGKFRTSTGAYHPSVHTDVYYRKVDFFLRRAKTKEDAILILQQIGRQLSKGTLLKWEMCHACVYPRCRRQPLPGYVLCRRRRYVGI